MPASFASWLSLIALLSSQTTSEASCTQDVSKHIPIPARLRGHLPVRERRCIFDCAALALAEVFGPDMFDVVLFGVVVLDVDIGNK